jgi:hypothetical protein
MISFEAYRLDTACITEEVNYPQIFENFIYAVQDTDTEVENARQNHNSLLENLQTDYINYTLLSNINGSELVKFSNMKVGINGHDYVTATQVDEYLGIKDVTEIGYNGTLQDEDSELYVSDINELSEFDTDCIALTVGAPGVYLYPSKFNAIYYLDWSITNEKLITLDFPVGSVPDAKPGDRLIFIFKLPGATDGISTSNKRIMGLADHRINFGDNLTFAIYSLVYVNTSIGWFFKNVTLGEVI